MFTNLNREASWNHWFGPLRYWLRQGCRPLLNVVRTTLPLLSGTQTVFVFQKLETFVFAGAFAGSAVEPQGIKGVAAGV